MVIRLTSEVESRLRRLAEAQGRTIESVVEEAIDRHLVASAINDVTAEELGETQMRLSQELGDLSSDSISDEAA